MDKLILIWILTYIRNVHHLQHKTVIHYYCSDSLMIRLFLLQISYINHLNIFKTKLGS